MDGNSIGNDPLHLITDTQRTQSFSCVCAASTKMRTHPTIRTNKVTSYSRSDSHCSLNSVKHNKNWNTKRLTTTGTVQDCHKKRMCYRLSGFIYLYFALCMLCMVTSSVSLENINIEDQLTQVGHFFFYNISNNATPLKDSFQLKAFEAGTDSLPDWLLFDDTLATFSGVPMENDAGNAFIEVNMFDNGQLISDEIFSIEVRPAGALMLTRKLSKLFIQKLTNPGLSDENRQQLTTEQTSEQRDFVQPLHFLPSHCPSVSNELIGNILLRSTAQLTPTQWVKLFMLLSDSLGIKVNNLYIRNVLYEDFGRKALVWGHYVGSDSLVDAPSNKTFMLMSFLIGCSKDSVYSDIYRVVIQRVNSLLESTDENSLLSVLERWLITLEGDYSTEAQKLHQRHKRQVAVEVPDVQQQDFYVVLTTAVTDAVVASTRIVITTASAVQSSAVTFSSEPILTTTVIPVVTMLPSSPVFSVEPTTVPFLTISSSFSADQTTMGITTSFITPSLSVIEPTMSLVFIESSLFITSPSILTFVSSSLIVATSIPELPSTSVVIDETTLPISILLSSLPILSSLTTDMITPSVTLEPTDTITTATSSLFISIETFSVTTTGEETSVFLTLAPTTPLVLSTSIPLLTSPSIPSETILSSPLFTDVDTTFITVFLTSASLFSPTSIPILPPTSIPLLTESFVPAETSLSSLLFTDIDATMTTLLTVSPTSAFSFVTTFSSELILSTQSDVIMSSSVFTDIIVPTVTMVSIDDTSVLPFSSAVLTSVPTIPSITVTSTPLLDTTLVETLTPVVTLASTTIETIQFTEVPTFSFEDTLTPIVITPSISDVPFFTTASIISTSPPLTITTPASTSILASPTFDITSAVMLTPSSDVDTFTTEIPNITLSVSETPIFSDTDIIDPTTDMFTSIVLSPVTSQIPTSTSFVTSFSSVFVTVDTPSIVMDTSVSETIAFTTIPSFDISSIIIMPSSDVISVDDTTGTIVTLPVTPTPALTATSIMTGEVISSTAFSFIDTLSFTAPSVTSVTMNITSAVPSSPDVTSITITPTTVSNISSVFTLPPVSISEDVFTTIQPDFTTSIDIPMTMTSDIMSISEVATAITSPSTMLPSFILTPTLIMTTMDEISPTITLMDTDSFTVIISSIPTVIVSSSLPSLTSGPTSEVISPSLTLMDTDSFTIPSMDSSIPISPTMMVPSIIPTPSFSPTDEISPTITLMGTDTPSVTMATVSSVRTVIFSPSTMLQSSEEISPTVPSIVMNSIVPTEIISPSTMLPSTSLIVTSPTDEISPTITLMSTDIPSVTIPSIVINSSIPSVITSPSTVLPSLTSSPISEVISPSITLMDTESFTTPSMNSSVPTEIISSPMILPTPSLILTSPTDEISPTITLMNTDSFTIVINSSVPTSPSTMLPSLTSSPTRVASPTITLTDVPSATIPSISSIPPSSLIPTTVTPTPTIVSSIVTMFSSIVIANTSTVDVVSPSSIINETSFITPSVTSILTPSMTLVDSTSIMLSSQVMTPNFTSVIELPSTTTATNITSIVTSITTQVDIISSITVIETSEFVPTTTLVIPTMITPSPTIMSPTTSITTTMITPTPTITNQPPQLINPIRALTWQEGQPALYEIPEDTFYDGEDGATSNLSLTLQTLPSQLVSNTSWIQLISGVLYGLPLKEQIQNSSVTEYVFILTAQDSQNVEVHDFLVIVVEPQDPFIANLITFFVEGDFTLFNQQIIEKTTLVNKLISFGLTNATDDVYIRDLFNGSIGLQYGNRTIGNADCTAFAMLIRSIFNNETEMYSNTFTTALLPYNVTKMPLAEGPCITTPPIIITPDLGASVNEERSSTKFIATVIPGVAVLLILLLLALFVCILYRRTHAGRDQITFVRRNTIALEEEVPNRQRRRNPALIEGQCGEVKLTGPDQPDMDLPPAYQRPITYEDYKTVTHCTT